MRSTSSFSDPVVLVIPCFNEERRIVFEYWEELLRDETIYLLVVDDGSTDNTLKIWENISQRLPRVSILRCPINRGKSEAVRQGLLKALASTNGSVGFLDADAAFPVSEVTRVLGRYRELAAVRPDVWCWSSRVQLAGRDIDRKLQRHYAARIVITILAARFGFNVYDPQSGFKVFPSSNKLERCLVKPFTTRWFVDLEILLRWRQFEGRDPDIWEEPVSAWRDVAGSKLVGKQLFHAIHNFISLVIRYERRG